MNIFRKPSHVLVVGKSGTGKTEYASRYFLGSRHDRVFAYDHKGECRPRFPGACVVVDAIEDFISASEEHRFVAYDPADEFGGNFALGLALWADLVFEIAKKAESQNCECLAFVDEMQQIVNPNDTPAEIKNLVQTGRKWALDTCFVSQQPNRLPSEVREQVTELCSFRLDDPRSLESLENFGVDIAEITTLPDLNYVWTRIRDGEMRRGVMTFPGGRKAV